MQNAQVLTQTNGCNKYVCKYVAKVDEQNRVIVSTARNKNGALVTESTFLHNTKITSSKINKDKALQNKRYNKHPKGRKISLMEMLQILLKYKEVHTNMNFENIPTMPLELRAGIERISTLNKDIVDNEEDNQEQDNPSDGHNYGCAVDKVRKEKNLPCY